MTPFFIYFHRLLLHWLGIRLDRELMTDDLGVNSLHVGGGTT